MSLDPQERLEALRREVLAERPPVPVAGPDPAETQALSPPDATRTMAPERPSHARVSSRPPLTDVTPIDPPSPDAPGLDLDLPGLIEDRSLSSWLGIGLLAIGGYLVLAMVVPGVATLGSVALAAVGIVLLYLHLVRGAPPWTLYAGGVLAGMGAARVVGALLPGEWHGTTAIGVGIAFLAIGYLRHSQAGGYGWQGVVGGAALGLGLVQLVLGWLPGAPGILDALTPAILLGLGALLVLGTRRGDGGAPTPSP